MFCRMVLANTYSQHELLKIGVCSELSVTADFHQSHDFPVDIVRKPGSQWITIPTGKKCRHHRERKQKWGWWAGALVRLRKQPQKPLLPSIFLSNASPSQIRWMN